MALAITGNQSGFVGRRYPHFPTVFVLDQKYFAERVANQMFVDPFLGGDFLGVITQFAQVGDIGVALVAQLIRQSDGLPLDISAASNLQIFIGLPDGSRITKSAQLYTDGLDGKLFCLTVDGDLPVPDIYSLQGKVVIGASTYYGSQQQFQVLDNIFPTAAPPSPSPHVGTFTQANLSANILTIYHYQDLPAPYAVSVTIFDNNGREIVPDAVIGSANSVEIDLSSFVPLSGTWGYVYV